MVVYVIFILLRGLSRITSIFGTLNEFYRMASFCFIFVLVVLVHFINVTFMHVNIFEFIPNALIYFGVIFLARLERKNW